MTDMSEVARAFRRGAFSGGVISIAMGVLLLVWPDKTLLLVAALIGVFLLLIGISRIVEAFSAKALPDPVRVLRGLVGLLLVILGIAVLRHLAESLTVLTVLLGIAWIAGGLAQLAFGLTSEAGGGPGTGRSDRMGAIVLGALDILAGLVLFLWPQTSLIVVVWLVGVWLIAIGVIQLVLGWMTRRPRLG